MVPYLWGGGGSDFAGGFVHVIHAHPPMSARVEQQHTRPTGAVVQRVHCHPRRDQLQQRRVRHQTSRRVLYHRAYRRAGNHVLLPRNRALHGHLNL